MRFIAYPTQLWVPKTTFHTVGDLASYVQFIGLVHNLWRTLWDSQADPRLLRPLVVTNALKKLEANNEFAQRGFLQNRAFLPYLTHIIHYREKLVT